MPRVLEPCLFDDESIELSEMRTLIEEFDKLYEICMTSKLDPEDQRAMNDIYECLTLKEYEYWGDCSDSVMAIITEGVPFFFPLIRQALGILPDISEL